MSVGFIWAVAWFGGMTVFALIGLWLEKRAQKRRERMEKMFYFGVACERARADRVRRNREQIMREIVDI